MVSKKIGKLMFHVQMLSKVENECEVTVIEDFGEEVSEVLTLEELENLAKCYLEFVEINRARKLKESA